MRIKEVSQREAKEKEEDLKLLRERLSRCTMVFALSYCNTPVPSLLCSNSSLCTVWQSTYKDHVVSERHEYGQFGARWRAPSLCSTLDKFLRFYSR